MFNKEEYVDQFVEAAVAEDTDKMKELASEIVDLSFDYRTELLSDIVDKLKKEEDANEEIVAGLAATAQMMQVAAAAKAQEDSTVEEAKDNTEAKEATQDVVADDSAEEAKVDAPEAALEGDAPTKEAKEEKPVS